MWSDLSISFVELPFGILIGCSASFRFFTCKDRVAALSVYPMSILVAFVAGKILRYNFPHLYLLSQWFYGTLIITIFVVQVLIYRYHYLKHKSRILNPELKKEITYIDFLAIGKEKYLLKVNELTSRQEIIIRQDKHTGIKLTPIESLVLAIRDFTEDKFTDGFLMMLFKTCQACYFPKGGAHFILRKFDKTTNSMVPIYTSRQGDPPGPIALNKRNLITLSLQKGCIPIKYSENKEYHYHTDNHGISKGIYNDYVSLCLIHDGNTPLYSLCLEVKGKKACEMMSQLVDSGEFFSMGHAFYEKILSLALKTGEFNSNKYLFGLKRNLK